MLPAIEFELALRAARDNLRDASRRGEPEAVMRALRTAAYEAWCRYEEDKRLPLLSDTVFAAPLCARLCHK
jgi:hypothetical protein